MFRLEYWRLRAKGWPASQAYRAAKVHATFQNCDNVRLDLVPDETSYDDSYIDSWDTTVNQIKLAKKELWERIERNGVWGLLGQYRANDESPWVTVYSLWGLIGDEWRDSSYDVDAKEEALEALDRLRQAEANELSERATYAG